MFNLNVFFHMVVLSCQWDKICDSTQFPAQPRNHGKAPALDVWRILHDRAEIWNLSSSAEKYFASKRSERVKYFSTREEKFRISKRSCNVLFII